VGRLALGRRVLALLVAACVAVAALSLVVEAAAFLTSALSEAFTGTIVNVTCAGIRLAAAGSERMRNALLPCEGVPA
jgi:hypothetical protein